LLIRRVRQRWAQRQAAVLAGLEDEDVGSFVCSNGSASGVNGSKPIHVEMSAGRIRHSACSPIA